MKTYRVVYSNGFVDFVNSTGIIDAINDSVGLNPEYAIEDVVEVKEIN